MNFFCFWFSIIFRVVSHGKGIEWAKEWASSLRLYWFLYRAYGQWLVHQMIVISTAAVALVVVIYIWMLLFSSSPFLFSFFVYIYIYIYIEIKNGKHVHIVTLHRPYEVAAAANNSDYFMHYTCIRTTTTEANTFFAHSQMLAWIYFSGSSPVLVITFVVKYAFATMLLLPSPLHWAAARIFVRNRINILHCWRASELLSTQTTTTPTNTTIKTITKREQAEGWEEERTIGWPFATTYVQS